MFYLELSFLWTWIETIFWNLYGVCVMICLFDLTEEGKEDAVWPARHLRIWDIREQRLWTVLHQLLQWEVAAAVHRAHPQIWAGGIPERRHWGDTFHVELFTSMSISCHIQNTTQSTKSDYMFRMTLLAHLFSFWMESWQLLKWWYGNTFSRL